MCCPYHGRAAALSERARRARNSFLPPADPPDRDRALEYLRDGVGPAVALYREARMAGEATSLSPATERTLDHALTEWLELYAACYGRFVTVDATVAGTATLLEGDATLRDTAARLTGIPAVTERQPGGGDPTLLGTPVPFSGR